jgi:hypothetical protein
MGQRGLRLGALAASLGALVSCNAPASLPSASAPQPASATSWDARRFEELKLRYMAALDDRPVDETAASVDMERRLGQEVDAVLRAQAAGTLTTDEECGQAGLVLIYDALLLQRNSAHAMHGKIERAALRGDTTARRQRAVALLEQAKVLRPGDGRIASWLAATQGMADLLPDGSLTAARKEQILAAVDVEPSFNLFTAYIAMRDEPPGTPHGRALFVKTQAFIAARKCRDVEPGTREARNCESGPLAPYNLQAATVMLGDQFLRQGEDALQRGAVPEAMEWLGTADGIYATLSTDRQRATTAVWSKAPLLAIRRERVAALKPGAPPPDGDFFRSASYASIYDCASCHVPSPPR